jgi:hypothetical protein
LFNNKKMNTLLTMHSSVQLAVYDFIIEKKTDRQRRVQLRQHSHTPTTPTPVSRHADAMQTAIQASL